MYFFEHFRISFQRKKMILSEPTFLTSAELFMCVQFHMQQTEALHFSKRTPG